MNKPSPYECLCTMVYAFVLATQELAKTTGVEAVRLRAMYVRQGKEAFDNTSIEEMMLFLNENLPRNSGL